MKKDHVCVVFYSTCTVLPKCAYVVLSFLCAAGVVVKLRINTLVEGVVFESSSYNFSLPENQPAGAAVGTVTASAGSDLHGVAYTLKTQTDLFSIDAGGALTAIKTLDKETQDWYILEVEAVDTRVPPTSAMALVQNKPFLYFVTV